MPPFVERQLIYCLASGLTTLGAWWLVGRHPRLASAPALRAAATALALAIPTLLGMTAVRLCDDWQSTYQFIGVAHGFYVGTVWIPVFGLAELARRRLAGRPGDRVLLAGSLLLAAAGVYSLAIEPNRLQVTENTLTLAPWPGDAPPLRVVHVSDLQTVGPCARDRRAAELINDLEPDLIVVTGDYVAGPFDRPEPLIEEARRFLGSLRARYGVVCIAGHSEEESMRRRIFAGLNLSYLRNEELELDVGSGRRLRIFGTTAYETDISGLERRDEPGLVTLVASHVPDLTRELDGRGVELHLAGHTHGGQVALPFFGAPYTLSRLHRRYARGLHEYGDHLLNVNPGIGMEGNHSPRIRFLCPPQIDLLLLEGGGPPAEVSSAGLAPPDVELEMGDDTREMPDAIGYLGK